MESCRLMVAYLTIAQTIALAIAGVCLAVGIYRWINR